MLSLLIFSFIALLTLTNKALGIEIIITIFTTVLTVHSTLKNIYVDMEELNTPGNELCSCSTVYSEVQRQ